MLPELDEAADRSPIFQLRPAWTPALMELPILGQLRGSAAKAHVMKDDHRLVTPEGLHQQLDLQSLPVRPVQPLGNSAAFVDQHIMPKMLDILMSDTILDSNAEEIYNMHITGSETPSWPCQHHQVVQLALPVVEHPSAAAAAGFKMLQHVQALCQPVLHLALDLPIAPACSSKDFLAQDLLLEGNCAMLPPVLLDPLPAFGSNAGACVISVHQMVSELKAKPFRSLAHLEMYLDWTLSDPTQAGTMQQRVLTAKSWIVDQLSPSSKLVSNRLACLPTLFPP